MAFIESESTNNLNLFSEDNKLLSEFKDIEDNHDNRNKNYLSLSYDDVWPNEGYDSDGDNDDMEGNEYSFANDYAAAGGRTIYIPRNLFATGLIKDKLHLACMLGNIDKVKELIEDGDNPNRLVRIITNRIKVSPLICACMYPTHKENIEIAKYLIHKGADTNITLGTGYSALNFATYYNSPEMTKILLDNGADVNNAGGEDVSSLHSSYYKEITKILLEHPDILIDCEESDEYTPLQNAYTEGLIDNIRYLLYYGADPKSIDLNDQEKYGNGIYKNGPYYNLNIKGEEVVQNMLFACDRLRKYGNKLHLACRFYGENITEIDKLIKNGVDINKKDNLGRTPLHYACLYAPPKTIYLLLENGASIDNIKDIYGKNPYYYLSYINREDAINKSKIFNLYKFIEDKEYIIYFIETDIFWKNYSEKINKLTNQLKDKQIVVDLIKRFIV